ncbi:SusC/RagA family TonB-linked outer membrane protein [Hymenobacter qilianensis]|uniref:TonB-dependent receptor n=3 Tax=Hymenobacter qilianensis TaxID=1385715 RepID=A0A7H0H0M6_9BACT|nr:TonB-dependent receptor [Hymenobacter qilianensis]GGF49950.1 SusC/RagA family TonB-linked outer membrane protein [Hymenobacter qilianensis]
MSILLMFTLLQQVTAQDRNVSGRVTDRQSGEGLPGVTVLLKGTNNGISTNSDGTFTLTVPATGGILVFSSIGYIQLEREIGTNDQINVALAGDTKQLSEVVVTGYGTQERRDVTGSISSVKGEEIANLATPSFDQQLAGRAAGVQVTTPSGILGQAPRIRIRGTNSISSGASPLIVVDGVPVITGNQSGVTPNNPLGDINPADIDSYEVLKDGSATAIYGSRAANGVILITTKKGKLGKATISYDNWFGWAKTTKRYDVLNADQFIEISNEKYAAVGEKPQAFPFERNGQNVSTDWQDLIFRTGFQQNHVISVGGATEKTNYYFSAGYTDQNAVIKANSLKRATFRGNLNQEVTKWLNLGMNVGLTRTENEGLNTGRNSLSGNVLNALSVFPNVPARNEDGTPYILPTAPAVIGQGNNTQGISFNYPNVLFALENNVFGATNYRILGNVFAEVQPLEGLRLRTQYGTDFFLNDDFQFLDPRHGDGLGSRGVVFQQFAPTFRWNWQNTIAYDKQFGDAHKIGVIAGVEYQKTRAQSFFAQGTGISDRYFGSNNIISGTLATPTVGGGFGENGFDSYFGRINYAFKDRYLLSATVRNDAISSLPEANRRGTFPGASLGWRVSQEPFFKSSGISSILSDLKLRASYAEVGNVDIGNYPYASLFGPAKYGSQNGIGYNINGQFGNENLKWETSKKKDFGVDLGFLDDRFTLTADYYQNNIDDLILFVRAPLSLGIPNSGYNANIGRMRNEGFEFALNTQNIANEDFNWTTNINFSTNKNEVLELNQADNNADLLFTYNVTRVGESIGSIYGYDFQGVNAANGNPIYRKRDGSLVQGNIANNTYYVYDPSSPEVTTTSTRSTLRADEDRFILGNSNPTWFGGVNNSFTYKGLDLSVFFRFSGGNKIMNVTRQQLLRMEFLNNGTEILDRWTTPGQQTNVPRLEFANSDFINLNNASSSRFVENGDFLRLQNATIGYTLPQNLAGVAALSRLRVYGQIQNAFTISGYKGLDPEVNANGDTNSQAGIDFNGNPQQRVFTVGLNASF